MKSYRGRTLLLHGRDDAFSPIRQAQAMAAALHKRSIPAELIEVDSDHRVPGRQQWPEIMTFLAARPAPKAG